MTDKFCHLCKALYTDDPFLKELLGHTPQQCLAILNWRCRELELKLEEAERALKRAEREYKK